MDKLKLGVSRKIITPCIGGELYGYGKGVISECINDDLTLTAFYFEQGSTKALMVSMTLCLINTKLAEGLIGRLEERFGVPSGCCMLCATHTHSGPDTVSEDYDKEYVDGILTPALFSAAEEAVGAAQPVRMGARRADSFIGINRRELTEDDRVILGQNPWGCFNPKMTVLSFMREDGTILANMIHYGAHCTAAGKNHEISRDWAGVMIDALERTTGGITAFFNGPEGDVGPRLSNGKTTGDLSFVYEHGALAARDAIRIQQRIDSYGDEKLCAAACDLCIPVKQRIPLREAEAQYELVKDAAGRTAVKTAAHFRKIIESYKKGEPELKEHVLRQRIIALGDIVFVSFPFEMFSEVGLRIDRIIEDKEVLSLACTNGSEGYFVTYDAICRGGYEVGRYQIRHVQDYCDGADGYVVRGSVQNIRKVLE